MTRSLVLSLFPIATLLTLFGCGSDTVDRVPAVLSGDERCEEICGESYPPTCWISCPSDDVASPDADCAVIYDAETETETVLCPSEPSDSDGAGSTPGSTGSGAPGVSGSGDDGPESDDPAPADECEEICAESLPGTCWFICDGSSVSSSPDDGCVVTYDAETGTETVLCPTDPGTSDPDDGAASSPGSRGSAG